MSAGCSSSEIHSVPQPSSDTSVSDSPSAESRYRALIDASFGVVWRSAPDMSVLETWGWDQATGQPTRDSVGRGWLEVVHPEDRHKVLSVLDDAHRLGQPVETLYRARRVDGQYRWVHARMVPLRGACGAIREWVGHLVDVHDKVEADATLRTTEERLRLALEASALGVWDYDFRTKAGWWSQTKRDVLGLPQDYPITEESFLALVHPDDRPHVEATIAQAMQPDCGRFEDEFRMRSFDKSTEFWVASCGQVFFDDKGEPLRIIGIMRDITAQRRSQEELYRLAHFDHLTGLANRTYFRERLEAALPSMRNGAVILLDLDGFKNVNDTAGHGAGDLLLQAAAKRLAELMPPEAVSARWGGDEFAVFLSDEHNLSRAELLGAIKAAFDKPFPLLGRDVFLSISSGVALAPANGASADELLQHADLALYRAKADGRGISRVFSAALKQEAQNRIDLEADLRRAFASAEFELHYQPQVDMADLTVRGAEALIRWRHPQRGLLTPAAFLQELKKSPIAQAVGDWTLDTACSFAAKMLTRGQPIRIGVNLFSAQLHAGGLPETVRKCLRRHQLPPHLLELEITEHTILKGNAGIVATLEQLRKLGVGIAFDDYGTGYASLSMLTEYPLTRLKIDRKFVQAITRPGEHAVVKAVVSLGHAFGMQVTAEGVETEDQQRVLRGLGCDEGQGYLFGRPTPAGTFLSVLRPDPETTLVPSDHPGPCVDMSRSAKLRAL